MNIKEEAYKLHQSGKSYKEIASQLNISKTAAYEYVKELKFPSEKKERSAVLPSSERVLNVHSERKTEHKTGLNSPVPLLKIKEFTGDELIKKKFDCLNFQGKFLELIGRPSKLFSGIIWGLPKGGKSNFSLRFADYLQEYFGKVCYVAAEEGESVTLQEKLKEIGGSKATIIETRNRDAIQQYLKTKDYDFVFIDSINNAGIDSDFLELLKAENPKKSFVAIVQATKGGNFKGDQALTHNCDFIIKVVSGVAYHNGRFQTASEIDIFETPLYKKNPRPVEVAAKPVKETKAKPTTEAKAETGNLKQPTAVVPPAVLPPPLIAPNELFKMLHTKIRENKIHPQPIPVQQYPAFNGVINPAAGKALLYIAGAALLINLFSGKNQPKKETNEDNSQPQ